MATLDGWRPDVVTLVGAVSRPGFSALLGAYSLLRNRQRGQGRHRARRRPGAARRRRVCSRSAATASSARTNSRPDSSSPRACAGRAPPDAEDAPRSRSASISSARFPPSISVRPRSSRAAACWRSKARRAPTGCCAGCGALRGARFGRAARREGGVLIKAAKRGQDLRVDMPTIGPRTVLEAAQAGLVGHRRRRRLVARRRPDGGASHRPTRSACSSSAIDLPWMGAGMAEPLDGLDRRRRGIRRPARREARSARCKARFGAERLRFGGVGGARDGAGGRARACFRCTTSP